MPRVRPNHQFAPPAGGQGAVNKYLLDGAHRPAEWYQVLHWGEELDELRAWRPLKAIALSLGLACGPFRGQILVLAGRKTRVVSVAGEGRVRLDDGSVIEAREMPLKKKGAAGKYDNVGGGERRRP